MPAAAQPVVHCATAAELRQWLQSHHSRKTELQIGLWRITSGRTGCSYSDALDEALCFGWIDGVRHKVDAHSYAIRFTPRRARSHWSTVNLRRAAALIQAGRMQPAGLAAYATRDPPKTARGSFEQASVAFPPALAQRFEAERAAWTFFSAQPPSDQRTATWWVTSAKREETRLRRLATLIIDSAAGRATGLGGRISR